MPTYDNKPASQRTAQPQKNPPAGQEKDYKGSDRSKDDARKDGKA